MRKFTVRASSKCEKKQTKAACENCDKAPTQDATAEENSKKEKLSQKLNTFLGFAGLLPILYVIANYAFTLVYQGNCQSFYMIPGKHFSTSVNNVIAGAVAVALFYFAPILWSKYASKDMTGLPYIIAKLIFVLHFGILIGCVNTVLIPRILPNDEFYHNNLGWILFLMLLLSIIPMGGILFQEYWGKIRSTKITSTITIVVGILFWCNCAITFFGFFPVLTNPAKKTSYEIVNYEETEYFVLSEDSGKLLIVPYKTEDEETYTLLTGQYRIANEGNCIYSTIKLSEPPAIDNESIFEKTSKE